MQTISVIKHHRNWPNWGNVIVLAVVRRGLTILRCKVFMLSSAASYILNNAPLCLGGSRQSLKVRAVKCISGDPATMWPVLFKGSRSLLLLA